MKKNNINYNIYREIVKSNEPHLLADEQDNMWQHIEQQIGNSRKKIFTFKRLMVAASIAAIVCGATLVFNFIGRYSSYQSLADKVEVAKLDNIVLQINDQRINLADNVTVRCDVSSREIDILKDSVALFSFDVPDHDVVIQIAVPAGESSSVILSDNSEVTLNTLSQLVFPFEFTEAERKVYISGEAYFNVSHNKDKKFIANTKSLDIRVLGTQFIVSAYPQDEEESVTLVSGRVQVNPLNSSDEVTMSPNEKFTYTKVSNKSRLEHSVNPEPMLSWTQNIINADNESLSSVLSKVEKYYNVKLQYDSKAMSQIFIEGKLDISVDIDEILDRISKIAPITFVKNKSTYIIKLTNP